MSIVGILLAAGYSRRFGGDKLLYPLPDGTPIAVAAARTLKETVDQTLAVVRPDSNQLASLLQKEGLEIIHCAQAERGMGASIACGIAASPKAQGWVIALADMPFIQLATVQQLVTLLRQGVAIVAPQYQGKRGHPVGFQRQFGTALSRLTGDSGAKTILDEYSFQVTLFSCEDGDIHCDIDTPQQCQYGMSISTYLPS